MREYQWHFWRVSDKVLTPKKASCTNKPSQVCSEISSSKISVSPIRKIRCEPSAVRGRDSVGLFQFSLEFWFWAITWSVFGGFRERRFRALPSPQSICRGFLGFLIRAEYLMAVRKFCPSIRPRKIWGGSELRYLGKTLKAYWPWNIR